MSLAFTTSWDDGHPLDLRLADLLAVHGIRGTFYVPRRNIEGREVMSTAQLRQLATGFEIGGHTLDHVRLDRIHVDSARAQIADGKARTEDELGAAIHGFCYPGGAHNPHVRTLVRAAGFRYARTTENLHGAAPTDPFRVPTTLQLFPHARVTYCKNFVRGHTWSRARLFRIALGSSSLDRLLAELLASIDEHAGVFHLWGHSWEIEERQLWTALDRFLARVAACVPPERRLDNAALYATH